jgi:hypothetical protein
MRVRGKLFIEELQKLWMGGLIREKAYEKITSETMPGGDRND